MRLAAIALVLPALLAGCGGDDSSGELSKQEVIRRELAQQIALMNRAADLYESRQTAQAGKAIQSGRETAATQRRMAQRYGFKACGSGSS